MMWTPGAPGYISHGASLGERMEHRRNPIDGWPVSATWLWA